MDKKIITENIAAITIQYTFQAWFEGTELTGPFSYGITKKQAIDDLKKQRKCEK